MLPRNLNQYKLFHNLLMLILPRQCFLLILPRKLSPNIKTQNFISYKTNCGQSTLTLLQKGFKSNKEMNNYITF